jgi:hypothetical protein
MFRTRRASPAFRRKIEIAVVYVLTAVVLGLLLRLLPRLSLLLLLAAPLGWLDARPQRFLLAWLPPRAHRIVYDLDGDRRGSDYGIHDASADGGMAARVPARHLASGECSAAFVEPAAYPDADLLHFVLPVVLLYVLWKTSLSAFMAAALSILLLSFSGYVTFLLFPAAPPWMAANEGILPPVRHVVLEHLVVFYTLIPSVEVSSAYTEMTSNPVAPFPSLHAGYALLIALWVWMFFDHHRWLGPLYCLLASFIIVLYGEHYVVDVIGGWGYAAVSFAAALALSRTPLARRQLRLLE